MSKARHSPEKKAMIAQEYLNGNGSSYDIGTRYNVDPRSVLEWAKRYQEHGIFAFEHRTKNRQYTSEFKTMCVELYISGQMSRTEIVAKYNISDRSVLRDWIMRYNANRKLKDYCPKSEVYMADARRKTTIEERKKIVEYCIQHNQDYKGTASLYNVSYSQVYSWVKKYKSNGEGGLIDKRGQHKTDDEVDELERLRRENIRLKRQLQEKDMLAELLKKVQEFERM